MSANNKVSWYQGLFLKPQHFQQQNRYVERYAEARCQALIPHSWGFTELEFERELQKKRQVDEEYTAIFTRGRFLYGKGDLPAALKLFRDAEQQRVGCRECGRRRRS